jgi:hypothetical protein
LRVYMDDALCRSSLLFAYGAEAMFGDWWNRIFLAITIPTLDLWCTTLQVVILPSLPAISRVELLVVVKSINVCTLKAPFLVHWTIFRPIKAPDTDWLTSNNLVFLSNFLQLQILQTLHVSQITLPFFGLRCCNPRRPGLICDQGQKLCHNAAAARWLRIRDVTGRLGDVVTGGWWI